MCHESFRLGRGRLDPGSDSAGDGAETLLFEAASEARAGRHEAALALLDRLEQSGAAKNPAALDLRARICAQLGFALEAERLWSLAAQADPANPIYPLALTRLRGARRLGPRLGALVVAVGAGTVLLWILGQGLQIATAVSDMKAQLAATADSAQVGLNGVRQDTDDFRRDTRQALGEVRTAVSDMKAQSTATADLAQGGGLSAVRQGIEDLGADTRHALTELRTAVATLDGRLDTGPAQPRGEAQAETPASGPTRARDADTLVADPGALLGPAGRRWRCEWQAWPASGGTHP